MDAPPPDITLPDWILLVTDPFGGWQALDLRGVDSMAYVPSRPKREGDVAGSDEPPALLLTTDAGGRFMLRGMEPDAAQRALREWGRVRGAAGQRLR